MNIWSFLVQVIPKHAIIGLLLWFVVKPRVEGLIAALTPQNNPSTLGLVLTTSGLILAGAVASFTRITFEGALEDNRWTVLRLVFAHLTTALQLFVIGILLLVAVAALGTFSITTELGQAPLFVAALLYVSLVTYDLYDILRQFRRTR